MILDARREGLILVEQEAHAWLTGELAARLAYQLPQHGGFVAAARVHDNGWREADQAPQIDAAGQPCTFTSAPDELYEAVWRRGIARAAAVDPLVGLLVGLHGARFFGERDRPGIRRLLKEERARQDEVLAALGLGGHWDALPDSVALCSDWIALLDALSLLLCGASLPDRLTPEAGGTRFVLSRSGQMVTVEPWPYDGGALDLTVAARRLPPGPYESDEVLREAWDRAEPFDLALKAVPAR